MASGLSASPDAAMTGVVDAFKRLQTTDSRRRALAALASELSPYEWRTLHAITAARSFQHDIVGHLPLELAVLVFRHVDSSAPYRLRLVSRRWNHILQSLDVIKASLSSWCRSGSDVDVDLSSADGAFCQRKAKSIHALRHGIPSSCLKLTLDCTFVIPILLGNLLMWQPQTSVTEAHQSSVHVLDLDTWSLSILRAEGRETIYQFYASEQLIALATYANICYVSKPDGQGRKSFKLPNSKYSIIACQGRTVIYSAAHAGHFAMFSWDYDTQRGTSFDLSPEQFGKYTTLDNPARSSGRFEAWWKDTCYGIRRTGEGRVQVHSWLTFLGTSDAPSRKHILQLPDYERQLSAYFSPIHMNETYVVYSAKDTMCILCFEPSDKRPTENGPFFDCGTLEVVDPGPLSEHPQPTGEYSWPGYTLQVGR